MRSLSMMLVGSFLLACNASGDGKGAASSATPAKDDHAAHGHKDAKPGSYEDWCGEHGVPESKCTRCNPKLIPAFKASNDWCAEHDLPESQCTKCNPDLKITRPAKGS